MSEVPLYLYSPPWQRPPAARTLIDSCITQLKAQEPSRTCNESKEEEEACTLARGNPHQHFTFAACTAPLLEPESRINTG